MGAGWSQRQGSLRRIAGFAGRIPLATICRPQGPVAHAAVPHFGGNGPGQVLFYSAAGVEGYAKPADGGVRVHVRNSDGSTDEISGRLLIAADGIHSVGRAQTHPDQAPIHWGGAVMWRGTIRARPPAHAIFFRRPWHSPTSHGHLSDIQDGC